MKCLTALLAVLLLIPAPTKAETHKSVQAALDYELPANTCSKPKVLLDTKTVTAPPKDAGSGAFFEGSSTSEVSDIDTYTRKRLERKEKKWKKCVAKYKKGLLADMEKLKGSARHGLTQEQATTILAHLATIQAVYMTPDGVPEQVPVAQN